VTQVQHLITKRLLRFTWISVVVVAVALTFFYSLPYIYPFIIAWVIAYAIQPFVGWLNQSVKLPRWLAIMVALLVYFGAAIIILAAAITKLIRELVHLTSTIEVQLLHWKNAFIHWSQQEYIQNLIAEINLFSTNNSGYGNTITKNIDNTTAKISEFITSMISTLLGSIVNIITSLPNLLFIVGVVLLAAFFISQHWENYREGIKSYIPLDYRVTSGMVRGDLQKAFFGYLRAQLIFIFITASLVFIGLLILQVDSPFIYALFIGLVDFLPYLGAGTIMLPWSIYLIITGSLQLGLGLAVLYAVILVVRQIIEPKILATNVGLKPLPTLISLFVGLKMFGILGFVVGPVFLVVTGAIYRAGIFENIRNYILHGKLR
jgi:sporulation integral membrane protein YtvI